MAKTKGASSQPRTRLSVPGFDPLYTKTGIRDKAKRYLNKQTGERISLVEFQKRARGGLTYREYRKQQEAKGVPKKAYKKTDPLLDLYLERVNKDNAITGLPEMTRAEAKKQADYKFIKSAMKSKDNSPTGKKAQALVLLGFRQPEWTWNVGDS